MPAMDPWAVPYFCYALLAMFAMLGWAQLRFNAAFVKLIGEQARVYKALAEVNDVLAKRISELEELERRFSRSPGSRGGLL